MEKREYPQLGETVFTEKIENGLTVMVLNRPGFQKKAAYFATNFGAMQTAFSLDGEEIVAPAGIAHFLEHKMFDMPDGRDISAEFAALGAYPNAFTSFDMTAYHFSCTENFENSLKLLLEFVSTPYFTKESVEKEQGIIGQEIDIYRDSPDSRVFENLMLAGYKNHPIRVPILGTRESIGEITPEILYQCHRAFYHPGNMLLCVMGDVEPEQVSEIARQMLSGIETPVVTVHKPWQEDMEDVDPEIREKMEVSMPMFQLGFKCEPAPLGEAEVLQEITGELAAEALFGESSQLYLNLYEKGLIDTSFGGGFDSLEGMAQLTAAGDSEHPEQVRDAILQEGKNLVARGIGKEDFLRMKRSAFGRRIRGLDRYDSTCFRLCAYHFAKTDYLNFPEAYRKVKEEDVLAFIKRVVKPERTSLSVIE